MTKFDELLEYYGAVLAEASRGTQFDDWKLGSVGLDKKSYLSQPASKPVISDPEPQLIECPCCKHRFYNVVGCGN